MTVVRQALATGFRRGAAVRGHSADPVCTSHSRMQLSAVCQLGSSVSRCRGEANKDSAVCRPVARVTADSGGQHVAQKRPRGICNSASLAARRSEHQVVFSVTEKRRLARVGKPAGFTPRTPAQRKVPAWLALLSGRVRKLQQRAQGTETSGVALWGGRSLGRQAPCRAARRSRRPSSGMRHTEAVVKLAVTRRGCQRRPWGCEAGLAK